MKELVEKAWEYQGLRDDDISAKEFARDNAINLILLHLCDNVKKFSPITLGMRKTISAYWKHAIKFEPLADPKLSLKMKAEHLQKWWKSLLEDKEMSFWIKGVKLAMLLIPSSADAERLLSTAKGCLTKQQTRL